MEKFLPQRPYPLFSFPSLPTYKISSRHSQEAFCRIQKPFPIPLPFLAAYGGLLPEIIGIFAKEFWKAFKTQRTKH